MLQIKIQQEFKTTPDYIEINHDDMYHMGVYLCIGQPKWNINKKEALPFSTFKSFESIHAHLKQHSKVVVLLGEGIHRIKKKSEQLACEHALSFIQ